MTYTVVVYVLYVHVGNINGFLNYIRGSVDGLHSENVRQLNCRLVSIRGKEKRTRNADADTLSLMPPLCKGIYNCAKIR